MNKNELVHAVARKADIEIKDATNALDALIDIITESLKKKEKVQLVGFGTFELRNRAAKDGFNPQTKKKMRIAASKSPTLKFGKAYKNIFNGGATSKSKVSKPASKTTASKPASTTSKPSIQAKSKK